MIGIGNKGISDLRLGSKSVSAVYVGTSKVWPSDSSVVAVTGVSLDKTSLSLIVGNTEQITATVKPDNATDKSVFWVSMDERIASVDQRGNVTAVGEGTTTVHAVATSNQDIYATCQVTAVAATVAVTGVSLGKTSLSLTEGASETLLATVSPANATNKAVTWSSSNDSVATVDANGKVTAVKAGTATITVRTVDGGKTASCSVNVTAAITLLDYIETDGKCVIDIGMAPPFPYTSVVSFKASNVTTEYYVIVSSKLQLLCYPSSSRWQVSVWRSQASSNNMSMHKLSGTSSLLSHTVVKTTVAGVYYETFEKPKLHEDLSSFKDANPSRQIPKWYDYTSEGNPTDNILLIRDMPSGSRLYGYMLWRDDTLVFNGVPAQRANEYGIYDVVTGAFHGNAGTGTLTGGNI